VTGYWSADWLAPTQIMITLHGPVVELSMLLKNTLISPECLHTSRDLTNSDSDTLLRGGSDTKLCSLLIHCMGPEWSSPCSLKIVTTRLKVSIPWQWSLCVWDSNGVASQVTWMTGYRAWALGVELTMRPKTHP
jgi:hypothetical protein